MQAPEEQSSDPIPSGDQDTSTEVSGFAALSGFSVARPSHEGVPRGMIDATFSDVAEWLALAGSSWDDVRVITIRIVSSEEGLSTWDLLLDAADGSNSDPPEDQSAK
ncbi:MAG: hypothetical protein JWN62_666 [Acidimicrobiales bacterium]|nr:hypothetical protein [Acidimicrobiales bacterium]